LQERISYLSLNQHIKYYFQRINCLLQNGEFLLGVTKEIFPERTTSSLDFGLCRNSYSAGGRSIANKFI